MDISGFEEEVDPICDWIDDNFDIKYDYYSDLRGDHIAIYIELSDSQATALKLRFYDELEA